MKKKFKSFISLLLLLAILGGSAYLIYSIYLLKDIENLLRYCVIGGIVLLFVIFFIARKKAIKKNKKKSFITLLFFMIIYAFILGFACYEFNVVFNSLTNITTSGYTTYSSSIVALKDNKAENINDIGKAKIGILNDEENIEGYIIPKEIIKKNHLTNKTKKYDSYIDMINDLQKEKIDYIFLPTKYPSMFKSMEGYENLEDTTKIIYTQTKKVKKKTKINRNGKLTEPFTVLLMGVDSEEEDLNSASFNGDSLMLITFNPKTLGATILSIPRDTYVPIACFTNQRKNKITHAAWQGEECMINTIQNFTGIDIDYYFKINFKGVVKLVDALGGIEVDVPIDFCEQDSNRSFVNEICLQKGVQKLDGEKALALSRHRKTINDFIRGQNQQLVVQAMLNQTKNIKSINTINKLLDTISNNMETNMSTNEILSSYNIIKDVAKNSNGENISDLIGFQRLYISGTDAYIYDYDAASGEGTGLNLYNFVPYEDSVDEVVEAMKVNLGLKKAEVKKSFSFDVDSPYDEHIIGKGEYSGNSTNTVPDFTGQDSSVAVNWANANGVSLNIQYVSATNESQFIGQIIEQSLPANMDINAIKSSTLTITVIDSEYVDKNKKEVANEIKEEEIVEEETENTEIPTDENKDEEPTTEQTTTE